MQTLIQKGGGREVGDGFRSHIINYWWSGHAGGVLGEAAVEIHYEKAGVGAGISWGRRAVPGARPSSFGPGLGAAPRDRSIPHSHLTHSPPLYT